MRLFKTKKQPSLLALQIAWFNQSSWIERLIATKQINKYIVCK